MNDETRKFNFQLANMNFTSVSIDVDNRLITDTPTAALAAQKANWIITI